jgi:hypothetical protein
MPAMIIRAAINIPMPKTTTDVPSPALHEPVINKVINNVITILKLKFCMAYYVWNSFIRTAIILNTEPECWSKAVSKISVICVAGFTQFWKRITLFTYFQGSQGAFQHNAYQQALSIKPTLNAILCCIEHIFLEGKL